MRCYDGAWDSEATALFKRQDDLMAKIKQHEPEAHCTYFPYEGEFQVHVFGRELSAICNTKLEALQSALRRIEK